MRLPYQARLGGWYISLWLDSRLDWERLPPPRRWPVIWFMLLHGAALGVLILLFMAWLDSVLV